MQNFAALNRHAISNFLDGIVPRYGIVTKTGEGISFRPKSKRQDVAGFVEIETEGSAVYIPIQPDMQDCLSQGSAIRVRLDDKGALILTPHPQPLAKLMPAAKIVRRTFQKPEMATNPVPKGEVAIKAKSAPKRTVGRPRAIENTEPELPLEDYKPFLIKRDDVGKHDVLAKPEMPVAQAVTTAPVARIDDEDGMGALQAKLERDWLHGSPTPRIAVDNTEFDPHQRPRETVRNIEVPAFSRMGRNQMRQVVVVTRRRRP